MAGKELYEKPIMDPYESRDRFSWGGYSGRPGSPSTPGTASGSAEDTNRYRGLGQAAAQRQAYQNDWSRANGYALQAQDARGSQMDALTLQQQAANGNAPSAAQSLSRNMLDQSLQAQMAGAASARGGSLAQAAAMRGASQQAMGMQQQGMNQIGALRAQEMAQARDAYSQGANAMRGQDFAAQGLAQQQQQADMQSELAQRQMNQQAQMGYEQMGWNTQNAQLNASLQQYGIDTNSNNQAAQRDFEKGEKWTDRMWGLAGGLVSGIGGILSDENAKVPVGLSGYAQPGADGLLAGPVGLSGAHGYRDQRHYIGSGMDGDMFAGVPSPAANPAQAAGPGLAPGSDDWAKYGQPGAADMRAAMTGGPVSATDWAQGGGILSGPSGAGGARRGLGSLMGGIGRGMMSDERAKVSFGEKLAGPRNARGEYEGTADGSMHATMPTLGNYADYGVSPRVHEGRGVLVQDPVMASGATTRDGGEGASVGGGLAKAAAAKRKHGGGGNVDLDKWADAELAKYRAENARLDRGEYRSALAPVVEQTRMADAARAMASVPYAYKPGMQPPEQAPGEPNVGPIAQNMAQNPVTATAVKRDPATGLLMVDQGKMTKVLGGVVANQQQQIDQLAALVAKRGQ